MSLLPFVPDGTVLLSFAIASLVLAITPGPDMALFVGRTISHGRRAGLLAMSGAMTGILCHTMAVALGLSALLVAAPAAFWLLKIVGALYLLYLAIDAVRSGSAFKPQLGRRAEATGWHRHYLTGIGINLLNPKVALFFLTFLPQFVSPDDPNAVGKLIFLGFYFLAVAFVPVLLMVLSAERFAQFLKGRPVVARSLDYLFGAVFFGFALRLLWPGRG